MFFRRRVTRRSKDFTDTVTVMNYLGGGAIGQTWTVKIEGKPRLYVAKFLKVLHPKSLKAEVRAMSFDECEYLPKLVYSGPFRDSKWCLIMDFADGGDLQTIRFDLESKKKDIPLEGKRTILYQMALGLEFLHSKNLTHG